MILYYIMALFASVSASVAHISFKTFAVKHKKALLYCILDIHLITGLMLFGLSAVLAIIALLQIDFSSFYSFTALNYLFISILSKLILKERIDRSKIIGNLMIIIGILVYNLRCFGS